MIEIEDKTIRMSRGDSVSINLTIPITDSENYKFKNGDKIQLRIFEKKNYEKELLKKEVIITEETEEVVINIQEEDTKFCPNINKPNTYWYEISLNEVETVVGYDNDGPAEFILYPAKAVV